HKSGSRKRRLDIETELFAGERRRISRLLGHTGGRPTPAKPVELTEEQQQVQAEVKAARRKLAL
ncbi:MAG: hypothetical protein MH204_04825, partial [Fimbriimonadaceae bacterium]|nr:hypothetical protein [Fimbriimonadaceae bacterium]